MTLRRVIACEEAQEGTGLSAKCGNEQTGCHPLGRNVECIRSGCSSVFEAGEAFMVFLLNDPHDELPITPTGP